MTPEAFAERVAPEPNSGCHLWTGASDKNGYGMIMVPGTGGASGHVMKHVRAHRVAWERSRGPIPEGLGVLHHCDTPACVNPAHLYLGTQRSNMRDASVRGRFGEKHRLAVIRNGMATRWRKGQSGRYPRKELRCTS